MTDDPVMHDLDRGGADLPDSASDPPANDPRLPGLPGVPELYRQARPAPALPPSLAGAPPPPISVFETRPTPLRPHYINLSVVALLCGTIAISALELGAPLGSPIVKLPVLVGAPLLAVTMADATLRIWRSAWAWMGVDRGRGLFRLAWVAAMAALYAVLALAVWIVLAA